MRYAPLLVLEDLGQARRFAEAVRRFEGKEKGDAWFVGHVRRYGRVMVEERSLMGSSGRGPAGR